MLATAEQVKQAMQLDVDGILAALGRTGYNEARGEILDVRFKGFNGSGFVYEIDYPNPEDDLPAVVTGYVYVSLKRRPLTSTYEFYAEY